jgi:uncharacterized membrane protein HdeD (DUF308 family)
MSQGRESTSIGEGVSKPPWLVLFAAIILLLGGTAILLLFVLRFFAVAPLWLLGLLLLAPLIRIVTEMAWGSLSFSLKNLFYGYGVMLLGLLLLLVVQFGSLPVLFLLGPVWFFMAFMDVVTLIASLIPSTAESAKPLLCAWLHLEGAYCPYLLIGYHLGNLFLLWIAGVYANPVMDAIMSWFHALQSRLRAQMEP